MLFGAVAYGIQTQQIHCPEKIRVDLRDFVVDSS